MIFSQHHDAPVAMPSAIRILSSVVTRRTRSGDILGAEQCIPVDAAIKSITLWAAYQHYEEATRGSIEVGKLADFVVLDKNPHSIPQPLFVPGRWLPTRQCKQSRQLKHGICVHSRYKLPKCTF
jgi:predicted amidohydrolase YtcJ